MEKQMNKGIVVICDNTDFDCEHMLQIVSKAKSLGETLESEVSVLCVGMLEQNKADNLFLHGADRIVVCRQQEPFDQVYVQDVISSMVEKVMPEVILIPATRSGKATAAIVSTRFEAGLTADCIDIGFDEKGDLYFQRAAINNSVIAKIKCINCNISMGTVKKDVFVKKEYPDKAAGKIEEFEYKGGERTQSVHWEAMEHIAREIKKDIDISQYNKVFCIGRGVKNQTNYERICKLAEKYGAGIVGTRAVVEDGLIEKDRQVGQSGKSISPHLYVGFGVSGASQHMVGIKNAEIVIAINEDENATIFNYADYSIVEKIEDILDVLERD